MATLGTSIHNPVWKTLWRLKIPSKIKIFAWRALHGLMPLKSILANRHIGTSGQCPICSQAPEDILHLLFQCQPASALWELLGLDRVIDEAILADWAGSAVLEHILMLQDNMLQGFTFVLKETIVIACWYLWWIRRRRSHNENIPPMAQCRMSVLAIAANSAKAHEGKKVQAIRWSKPDRHQIKLNVDGYFFSEFMNGAAGAILRDYKGQFIAATSIFLQNTSSAMAAEARAMKEGLTLAVQLGCSNIIAESDSMDIIEECTGRGVGLMNLQWCLLIVWTL
jgi:hypothetical protein